MKNVIVVLLGCIPVESAHVIHQDLFKSQQCLVLATNLHLLFLTTSAELSTSIQPNWMRYFENVKANRTRVMVFNCCICFFS